MRVYADGSADMVLRPGFLDIYPRGGSPRRIAWEEPPKKGGLGLPRRRVLAVAHGSHAWIGEGRGVRVVPLDVDDVRDAKPLGVRVLDAVSLSEGRVLVCAHLEGDDGGACLRVVDGRAPDLAAAAPLAFPEPVKVEWPAGSVWKAGKETWPEKAKGADKAKLFAAVAPGHPQKDGGRFFDSVVLTKSPHGVAGASVQNGVVFVMSPDGTAIQAALRMPTHEDASIHPVRTAEGVLVTIVVNAKESALLHFTLDGRVLAHRSKIGKSVAQAMSPPMLFGASVLVFDRSSDPVLLELGLSDLEIKGKHGLPGLGAGEASIAFASDAVLVSDGEAALRVTIVAGAPNVDLLEAVSGGAKAKKKTDDDLGIEDEEESDTESEDEDDEETIAPIISSSRPRATGAPSLTLAEAASPSVWALASGATLNVVVGFANLGGLSKGVFVEVAGQAVLAGLVAAGDVRIGATSTRLEKKGASFRAEVPAVELHAGLLPDPDEKRGKQPLYEGIHRANVTLDGLKAGSGLVTIRIGPMKAEPGRGSIVQGKTLAVR